MKSKILNFVFSITKSKRVNSLWRGTVQGLCHVKEVCKLRLENDPHVYGSKDTKQILKSSVKRKSKSKQT